MGDLTDKELKNLKPRAKLYKVTDRDGMHAAVTPTGVISFEWDELIALAIGECDVADGDVHLEIDEGLLAPPHVRSFAEGKGLRLLCLEPERGRRDSRFSAEGSRLDACLVAHLYGLGHGEAARHRSGGEQAGRKASRNKSVDVLAIDGPDARMGGEMDGRRPAARDADEVAGDFLVRGPASLAALTALRP